MSFVGAGLATPTTSTVARRPESMRRTSHVDMIFGGPAGPGGLRLVGRARDLYSDRALTATVAAEAEVDAGLDAARRLQSLATSPPEPTAGGLIGALVGPGFRASLESALGEGRKSRTPLLLLLDDLPVAALISGYATLYESGDPDRGAGQSVTAAPADPAARMVRADICSGWRSDGTMMVALRSGRGMPTPVGPAAPELADPEDPVGWHRIEDLPPGSMRRRRLVDVAWGQPLAVRAMFRDTHRSSDGVETVLHEYTVEAAVDPATHDVLDCDATPRSLPWVECEHAAASASRLVGLAAGDLRSFVRTELKGTTTCTHLNDLLRSLADVPVLAAALAERVEPTG